MRGFTYFSSQLQINIQALLSIAKHSLLLHSPAPYPKVIPNRLLIQFLPRHANQRKTTNITHPPQSTPNIRQPVRVDEHVRKGIPETRQRVRQG